jgi:hypothetical protein
MEVGSLRERIIIALLIYKFGQEVVQTDIPITESEIDVKLFGYPVSIKSITNSGGVKAVWTVDAQSSLKFVENYAPKCDILLVRIKESNKTNVKSKAGGFFWIPLEVQQKVLKQLSSKN